VLTIPLIASPDPFPLIGLSWSLANGGEVLAQAIGNHGMQIGVPLDLVVSLVTPIGYNGLFRCVPTGPDTFVYPLEVDPGGSSVNHGVAGREISMTKGYFTTRMVYFSASNLISIV
jgi:hypothetical protein